MNRLDNTDRRIGYQNINSSKLLQSDPDELNRSVLFSHIALDDNQSPGKPLLNLIKFSRCFLSAKYGNNSPCAALEVRSRNRQTDARRSAGDDRDLVLKRSFLEL